MDALIRWCDHKKGRRYRLADHLGMTRSGVTQMLQGEYLRTQNILPIHEFTGIPIRFLVRRVESGLTEGELAELDQIARKRELTELEKAS